jgi:hypothetical protein
MKAVLLSEGVTWLGCDAGGAAGKSTAKAD